MKLPASLYRQFDADPSRDVPAENYLGWHRVDVELNPQHTALVVMHAWDCGDPGQYPGWERAVEYQGRARAIIRDVLPGILRAVRASSIPVFHVVDGGDYFVRSPGFSRAVNLAGKPPVIGKTAPPDKAWHALQRVRRAECFPGEHNEADIAAGFSRIGFAEGTAPVGDEGVAADGHQLAALCRDGGINHLVYTGFAINWCLLMSPGGMLDMSRRGAICSVIREATTAVENKETAREEREMEQALWRTSLEFGFVFHAGDFIRALPPK